MFDYCHPTRIASDFSYSLCLSQHVLPSCAMDLYFIDLCKLKCILDIVCNYLHHIYVSYIYQSSATKAWYKPVLFSIVLAWFDPAHNKFDHRASVRTLDLILQSKIVYIFVPRRAHDYMNLTYTCNFSCILFLRSPDHINKNDRTCYICIYCAYTLFFSFLPFSAYPKPRTAFILPV
jgi:hypothetical protein